MKNYKEIYEKIENPLNDDEVVRKLIEGYSDELRTKQYYNKLVQVNYKEKKYKEINMEDKDRLVSQIFNEWKNDITKNISDEDIKSYNNQDFVRLRECIKNIPDIKDFKENSKVFNRLTKLDKLDKDSKKTKLTDIYEDYAPFFHGSTWTYISHNSINPSKYKKIIVDHRLYLNTENIDTYKVMELFRNKCKERELDYHFKFSDRGDRDDTIVIYSDDKKLSKYLEILEEIKKEEPEIIKRAQTPPMLTGKIDGWIGYGSEPSLDENGKNTKSFNSSRSGIIQNAISKETIKWLRENKELTKEDLELNEYLTKQISDDIKDKYNRMDKSVYEPEFQEKLLKRLEKEIEKNKSELLEGKFDKIKEFNIDGINIEVDSQMIQRAFRPLSKKILKKDPSFLEKVRDGIKEEGLANGIDSEKFCFDIDKRDKLFNEDKTNEILKTIDPQFLNKKIKFAGFAKGHDEIEYERYIRAVVKELPKDKNIIMKDGRQLTPKQFIENEIPKLEQKYNININKLLEENIIIEKEKTKTNKNKNNIEQRYTTPDNSKNEEYNKDILKNINKDVLNKKVQVGEGREITYKEYLEKYVMHKMPKGEKIKLKNGIEIPTKQYIEEVLLQEKSKYGLNIDSMLADTIKDYAKKENEKTKSINTNNIRNNVNGMDFKDNVIEEARISNDGFKDNTDKEKVQKQRIQKVLLETEKTNLPMKIGFFEKIKQGFKKIKEIAHKVKEWVDKKKDSFFRGNIKLVDIDLEELEKSETNDNLNKPEEKEIVEDKENKKVEKTIVEEEKERNNIINEEKEVQDNMNYKKITNSEILQNKAVKEKIEEYMKNLNDKVKNSSNSQKDDKDLDR
ncbi:MAG: hypothetical protein HG454_006225 [Clostridiales bacterium]|nr:hypothetical protein [Clostridiales bacterium]